MNSGATGRLESDLAYVDEVLVDEAVDLYDFVYIRRVQAGFVLSRRISPLPICGISSTSAEMNIRLANTLEECTTVEDAQLFAAGPPTSEFLPWLSEPRNCPEFEVLNVSSLNVSGSGSMSDGNITTVFSGDYIVDGSSADLLQQQVCPADTDNSNQPVASYAPDQTTGQVTATVFYNNNVSYIHVNVSVSVLV